MHAISKEFKGFATATRYLEVVVLILHKPEPTLFERTILAKVRW